MAGIALDPATTQNEVEGRTAGGGVSIIVIDTDVAGEGPGFIDTRTLRPSFWSAVQCTSGWARKTSWPPGRACRSLQP
jgi:hypothetical protein